MPDHSPNSVLAAPKLVRHTGAVRCFRLQSLVTAIAFVGAASLVHALPTTSVVFENLVSGGTPPGSALLDADGATALDAGTAADGDGALVALGYFTGATTAANFDGTWIPLHGPTSANTGVPAVTIGDTGSNASGAFGFFTALLHFDSANPATFAATPSVGTRLAVAIFNRASLQTATHFTIATNDAWRWKAPSISPDFVSINLNDAGTIWLGGSANARRASEAINTFPGSERAARLINISTRGFVGTDSAILIPGFVVAGTGTKTVLVRAVGPTLGDPPFGVSGVLADPQLRAVRQDNGAELAANDDWFAQPDAAAIEAATNVVGAFVLPQASKDSALRVDLTAGFGYTAQISGAAAATGVVLAEAYVVDDGSNPDARISNLSTRGFVGTGDSVLIAGFVVGPGSPRRLLIRGVGPTLAQPPFGLPDVLANPQIRIFSSAGGDAIASNDNWESGGEGPRLSAAAAGAGAFELLAGSQDAALLFTAEGNAGYTVEVTGVGSTTGIAIVEIYELP